MFQTLFTDTVKLYCVIFTDTAKLYCVIYSFTYCVAIKYHKIHTFPPSRPCRPCYSQVPQNVLVFYNIVTVLYNIVTNRAASTIYTFNS